MCFNLWPSAVYLNFAKRPNVTADCALLSLLPKRISCVMNESLVDDTTSVLRNKLDSVPCNGLLFTLDAEGSF